MTTVKKFPFILCPDDEENLPQQDKKPESVKKETWALVRTKQRKRLA